MFFMLLPTFYRYQRNKMVYETFLNWFALSYQVQHSLTTREWKPMLFRLSMLRSFVHELLVTLALGYLYEWLTTIESADRKDLTSQWPLFPIHIDHNITLISGLSTFISQWSWNSLCSQHQDPSNIFVLIGRNYPLIVWMWPRDPKP